MRSKKILRALRSESGQNLVEFALVVPILLLVVIGIAEFGRAWMTKNIMTGAAREAARMAAVPRPTGVTQTAWDSAIRARADNILTSAGIGTAVVTLTPATGEFDPVSVTVTYNFPVITGLIPGLENIVLTSTTSMRREY